MIGIYKILKIERFNKSFFDVQIDVPGSNTIIENACWCYCDVYSFIYQVNKNQFRIYNIGIDIDLNTRYICMFDDLTNDIMYDLINQYASLDELEDDLNNLYIKMINDFPKILHN